MNSKSFKFFKRWIKKKNDKISFNIIQHYYIKKEYGQNSVLLSRKFLFLFLKRILLVFLSIVRIKHTSYKTYFYAKSLKEFFKRLLGLYKYERSDLQHAKSLDAQNLSFSATAEPLVSIIIAVPNHLDRTFNCLVSILKNTADIEYEIILVNDKSNETSIFMSQVANITYLENEENIGFLKSCNKASLSAKGKYLCFLNNDTQVTAGWLKHMLNVFELDKETGLVGAKLIYPYGLLREAGGLINNSGEPANFGRFEDPSSYTFNYLRECDYCSGACIIISREDFTNLGGFDQDFAPAYYEDTDLAFSVRYTLNKKVYYQPLAEVIHFEGISSGKTIAQGGVNEYQKTNSLKFIKKWKHIFDKFPITKNHKKIARKFTKKQTILFIDEFIPEPDTNSGSRRIFEIMKIFKLLNYEVLFLAHNSKKIEPYFSQTIALGVQVLYSKYEWQQATSELLEIIDDIDIVWISRPELNKFYLPYIKKNASITWAYDTVDLHFIREERKLALATQVTEEQISKITLIKQQEVSLAKRADITIAITNEEAEILRREGVSNVVTITNVHIPFPGNIPAFQSRSGLIFIGGYYHQPNIDAVFWLVNEIMPIVWAKIPDIKVTLLGSNPSPEMTVLNSDKVQVTGYVKDVTAYFLSARAFVAPLRYGAGMKGKIGQSLEYGLPIVTTDIGAEGMDLEHQKNVLIGNTKEEIAQCIIELYHNNTLWSLLSSNATNAITRYSPESISKQIIRIFDTK